MTILHVQNVMNALVMVGVMLQILVPVLVGLLMQIVRNVSLDIFTIHQLTTVKHVQTVTQVIAQPMEVVFVLQTMLVDSVKVVHLEHILIAHSFVQEDQMDFHVKMETNAHQMMCA